MFNADICEDVSKAIPSLKGNFRVFYQNIAGLQHNSECILKLLDSQYFDIIALNETHCMDLHRDFVQHVRRVGYVILELPARRFSNHGRAVGGSLVLVKKSW